MVDKKLYTLLGKMALEYRLSLDNICKILKRPVTDETKMEVYENIKKFMKNYYQLKEVYDYLFFYETVNEPEEISLIAYYKAKNYLLRHNKAIKEGNKEKLIKIKKELTKTDTDFINLRDKGHDDLYTVDDIAIITKYRLKYAISRENFCEYYYKVISLRNLEKREKQLESSILKRKIDLLSDYYLNFFNDKMRNNKI